MERFIPILQDLMQQIWKVEDSLGWHDKPNTLAERLQNITAEVGEAWEEHRKGKGLNETYYECKREPGEPVGNYRCSDPIKFNRSMCKGCKNGKPCGIPSELADIVIWLFDYCQHEKIDLAPMIIEKLNYNATRSYRHGGKQA